MGIVINLFMMTLQMTNTLPIDQTMDEKANLFIREHESLIKPLEISSNLAWWEANISYDGPKQFTLGSFGVRKSS